MQSCGQQPSVVISGFTPSTSATSVSADRYDPQRRFDARSTIAVIDALHSPKQSTPLILTGTFGRKDQHSAQADTVEAVVIEGLADIDIHTGVEFDPRVEHSHVPIVIVFVRARSAPRISTQCFAASDLDSAFCARWGEDKRRAFNGFSSGLYDSLEAPQRVYSCWCADRAGPGLPKRIAARGEWCGEILAVRRTPR